MKAKAVFNTKSLENKDVVDNSIIKIRCTKAGAVGNVPKGTITQMPITIAGINAVINDDAAKVAKMRKQTMICVSATMKS